MTIEPTTPVLVGVGAVTQTLVEPGAGLDDTGLIVEAARAAVADAGISGASVDWIAATRGLAMLPDPGRRVSEALGAAARTVAAWPGIPQQTLVNMALEGVRAGDIGVAIVCGGEAKRRADIARRAGVELAPHDQAGLTPDTDLVPEGEFIARPEIDVEAVQPVQQYALIENARRAAAGWTVDEHLDDIAEMWSGFNEVARHNPAAAFAEPMSAGEIRSTSGDNRMLAWPYNKWHNSQWAVDQASAMLLCSVATAEELGVARDRWVFPHAGLESSMSLSLSRRADLHRWPAMGVLGDAAREHTGRAVADMDHVEVYSCFPVAVRVQQAELGLDPSVAPTITGGMAFAGGPFNNFVYQATVAMIERLRSDPGSFGAVTVVSGLLTKPGLALWSTEPPANGVLVEDLADAARAATTEAPLDEDPSGAGTVATYTVLPADDGPGRIVAIVDLDSGDRAVAALDDPAAASAAVEEDLIGAAVRVEGLAFSV